MSTPRFRVSLSFSGEKRAYVEEVANVLADALGDKNVILYDRFHEAELSRARLNRYLPKLYHEESSLVVAVFSSGYRTSEWCGLEWDAIVDLIGKRQEAKVQLCRFDRVQPEGLYGAGYADLDGRSARECAVLILERLALNEGKDRKAYTTALEGGSKAGSVAVLTRQPSTTEPEIPDPVAYEARVRKVFGPQFDQLKGVLDKHPALKGELARHYECADSDPAVLPARLIMKFHLHFLEAINCFYRIADESQVDRGALVELVSSVIYLSMCPDFAESIREEKDAMKFEVSRDARQGIAEMLLVWNRHQGRKPYPAAQLGLEKTASLFETPPQSQSTAIKFLLMDRLGIKRDAVDAEQKLRLELEKRKGRGHPERLVLAAETEADHALLREISAPDSALRHLLILLKIDGRSIHPRENRARQKANDPSYDLAFEEFLSDLVRKLTAP